MEVYAKQSKDGKLIALMTYSYTPHISPDSGVEIITEEEYNELLTALRAEVAKKLAEKLAEKPEEYGALDESKI